MKFKVDSVGGCAVLLAGAVVLSILVTLVAQGLWNWLMPFMFGLPALTFWQMAGFLALINILFFGPAQAAKGSK